MAGGASSSRPIPGIFVAHEALGLAPDAAGRELAQWGRDLPRPRAILAVSSRWQAPALTRGSTAARPQRAREAKETPLREVLEPPAYPAPGAPELAYDVHTLLPVERAPGRGWDRGVWGPLLPMFPEANIPVLQLSLVLAATPRALFAIGRKLGVLAARGVLIMGSGAITSGGDGVRARDPGVTGPPADEARDFDAWVANVLADAEIEDLLRWRTKAPRARAVPAASSGLDPLFVVAGAASLYEHAVGFPIRGFVHDFSKRCVQFGR